MNAIIYILSLILIFEAFSISLENKIENDKLYILIGEKTFLVNLVENQVTKELISVLPMKIKLQNEDVSSKSLSLRIQIETSEVVPATNSAFNGIKGDLILFQGKELILLNEETFFENDKEDYLKIGHTEDAESLFSSITKNKRILLWNSLNYENNLGKVKPYAYYNSIMNYFTWKIFTFFCFLLL